MRKIEPKRSEDIFQIAFYILVYGLVSSFETIRRARPKFSPKAEFLEMIVYGTGDSWGDPRQPEGPHEILPAESLMSF
jgi:hypothetical protein